MKITPLEVREYRFKKIFRGYDPTEVDTLKDILSETLEELSRENIRLDEELKRTKERLEEYKEKERLIKDTITMAQKAADDMKDNARKEAELIISDAKIRADEILKDAHHRFLRIQDDIEQLKKQRIQLESEIKAVIDYHRKTLFSEEEKRKDEELRERKVKFLNKQT